MKSFLAWILGVVAVAVIADCLLGVAIRQRFTPENMPAEYRSIDRVLSGGTDSVLVLGSSVAMYSVDTGRLADSLGVTAYNGGAMGQTFTFYLTMLKAVAQRPVPPRVILLGLSTQNLCDRGPGARYSILAPYYGRGVADVDSVFTENNPFRRMLMHSNAYAYNINWVRILLSGFAPTVVEGDNGFVGLPEPAVFPVRHDSDTQARMRSERRHQLEEFARICSQRGIRLIVFFTPTFTVPSDRELLDTVQAMGSRMGFEVWDDLALPPFSTDSTLYYDHLHLNLHGARIYTDTLTARIRNSF